MCEVFADIKSMVVGFFFFLEADAALSDGGGIWWHSPVQGSEISPGLFQCFMDGYNKTLRPSPLVIEHSVVVMSASSQSRRSQIKS